MTDEHPLEEEFIIEDVETLKVISDPLRLQIIRNLEKPRTVKDLAERLDTPATKLYYHVNQLEKHNIIRVVDTRLVSGIVEKHYQVTARSYHVSKTLLKGTKDSQEQLEVVLSAIFDTAKAEMRQSVEAGLLQVDEAAKGARKDGSVWHSSMSLTPEKFAELNGRLQTLLEEFEQAAHEEDEAGKAPYGLVIAFYPVVHNKKKKE